MGQSSNTFRNAQPVDRHEIEDAYRKYGPLVWMRIKTMLLRYPGIDQEQTFQEVFVRAVANWNGFRGKSSRLTWIMRIATNLCLDSMKQRRWRVETSEQEDQPGTQDWTLRSVEGTDRLEARVDVVHLLAKMPRKIRDVAVLYHLDRFTLEEVASQLSLSRRAVQNRLKKFEMLSRKGIEP